MITRRSQVSGNAESEYAADVALAAQFDDLLAQAREAEQVYRKAQAQGRPDDELYPLAVRLDVALTERDARRLRGPAGRDRPARL